MDDTLPENAWKDPFDNLMDSETILKTRKILKKDIRASFNMDSSVENSRVLPALSPKPSLIPDSSNPMSTPVAKSVKLPFKCSISPIEDWKMLYFDLPRKSSKEKEPPHSKEAMLSDHNNMDVLSKPDGFNVLLNNHHCLGNKELSRKKTHSTDNKENTYRSKSSYKKSKVVTNRLTIPCGKWRKSVIAWKRNNLNADDRPQIPKISVDNKSEVPRLCHRKSLWLKSDVHSIPNENLDPRLSVMEFCYQKRILSFDMVFNKMETCRKIGEGVFGEVFLYSQSRTKSQKNDKVLKIIPIEGTQLVNGEIQKTFELILPEIIISKELSSLRNTSSSNKSSGFLDVEKVYCVKGKYPKYFLKCWHEFDAEKGSENDNPEIFKDDQLFIILESTYAGRDLASFEFRDAEQSFFTLLQIVLTLGVAEEEYQFEHRDLHLGNILLMSTRSKTFHYSLQGQLYSIPLNGVKATIIDYTLSRMKYKDCCLYNDLSTDADLFEAEGDYQFDIYRIMRDLVKNKWDTYEPKTNVFWISYVVCKMIEGVNYKNTKLKKHWSYMNKLMEFQKKVIEFNNAIECAKYLYNK